MLLITSIVKQLNLCMPSYTVCVYVSRQLKIKLVLVLCLQILRFFFLWKWWDVCTFCSFGWQVGHRPHMSFLNGWNSFKKMYGLIILFCFVIYICKSWNLKKKEKCHLSMIYLPFLYWAFILIVYQMSCSCNSLFENLIFIFF